MDDRLFNSFTVTDWEYYSAMLSQDEKELDDKIINAVEYMAMFVSPENLQNWRDSQDSEDLASANKSENGDGKKFSDDEFAQWIASWTDNSEGPKFK